MKPAEERPAIASLAHGLAHEVAALTEARTKLDACCPAGKQVLDAMIEKRKQRIAALGAKVDGHA